MRRRSIEMGTAGAFFLLLISRSTLSPAWVSQLAPLLALGMVLFGLLPHFRSLRVPPAAGFLLVLVITYAGSSAASGSLDNFIRAASIGSLWLVMFVVAYNINETDKRRFFAFVIIVGLLEAGIAVGETVLAMPDVRTHIAATQDGSYLVRPNTILGPWTNRAQGTVGYPIPFSHFLSLCAVLTLFGPLQWGRVKRLVIAGILSCGVLLTGTRSGVAALVACVLIGIFLISKKKYSGFKYVMLLLIAFVGVSAAVTISTQESLAGDGSYTHRVGILSSLLELSRLPAERIFFGSGINSHESLFLLGYFVGDGTYAIDNSFVTLLICSGLVGLIAFLGLLAFGVKIGRIDEAAVLVGFAVFAMSYDFVNWHLMAFIFFFVLGLAYRSVSARSATHFSRRAQGRFQLGADS